MILIINTCQEKLSEEEFVKPIIGIVKDNYEIKHYAEEINFDQYEKIIICGTALQDFSVLEDIEKFSWLKETDKPVLGICVGAEIIGLTFNAKLIDCEEIGMVKIKKTKENKLFSEDLDIYSLHKCALDSLNEFDILAESDKCVHAFKLKGKEIYGLQFHPEVKNPDMVGNFLEN